MTDVRIIFENYTKDNCTDGPAPLQNRADIWMADAAEFIPFLGTMTAWLSAEEIAASKRYRQEKDARNFSIRRGLLRLLLGRYTSAAPGLIEYSKGPNKRPVLQSGSTRLHFNTSHSDDLILFVFSDTEVGIDVERINSSFDYQEVLKHSFSPEEIAFIEAGQEPRKRFYTLWTRKEALLKATSKGVDDDMAQVPVTDGLHRVSPGLIGADGPWMVRSFCPAKYYQASIAYRPGMVSRLLAGGPDELFKDI